ncbi:hypothetical protein N431DRAFT_477282 [Stipitochalara longipes BDJ]|nr:hypothetical protein N431DRAFT_477282 [Stipitochalara longipes BDJ]
MAGEQIEVQAMNSSVESVSNESYGSTIQVRQEGKSMSEHQAQEEFTVPENQSNSKQISARMYKRLAVGMLKDNSDVLVYARGRKQANVDREMVKLYVTEEAAQQNSLDLSKPLQNWTVFYEEFRRSAWEKTEEVILAQIKLRGPRVEKDMVPAIRRSSIAQRAGNFQVNMILPDTPARSHPEQCIRNTQQKSQVSPISDVPANSTITGEQNQNLQNVQSEVQRLQVEPRLRVSADVSVVNVAPPQHIQRIEDDEDSRKDEDLENFIADTDRAREVVVEAAMRYGHSMKSKRETMQKVKKSLLLREKDLDHREALIGDKERGIERQLRILQEEQNLNKRMRELEVKEVERRQLRAELEELPARVRAATAGFAASLAEPPRDLDLEGLQFEAVFEAIPNGCPDAGTFKEKIGLRISMNGKQFDELQYLTPLSELVVDGQLDGKSFSRHSRPYSHYTKDGSEKMVQKLIPECLVQYQGNYYIRRLVLKEIKENKARDFSI